MKPGDFVWYELCTTDTAAAAKFYAEVVGWTITPSGLPGIDYSLFCIEDRPIAGLMTLPPAEMPPHPVWFGYIAVDDVDAKAEQIEAACGAIYKAPQDIPTVGRFAVVTDPQQAVFMLFKGAGEPPPPLPPMQTGSIGWHSLLSKGLDESWNFYEHMFGWSKDTAHDMGPMGVYQVFKASDLPIGGMMTVKETPRATWIYYFVVDDIDAGVARVKANGGTVQMGPDPVPGGAWIINAQDPQGGNFALVGMRAG
jgi:predicted enzyme related to lactoylglutathione lyase